MTPGVDDGVVNEDTCKIEHIVSSETLERLNMFLEFVKKEESVPRWGDHSKYFYETGEHLTCSPETSHNCPVHGKNTRAPDTLRPREKIRGKDV